MPASVPKTMQGVALSKYGPPSEYDLATIDVPKIARPDDVLIKVHATSINPVDVKLAGGMAKMMMKAQFPYTLAYDVAGIVAAVGTSVKSLKVGDEVYSRIPTPYRGALAEYCVSTEEATAIKPAKLSMGQAAAIPLAGLTALQALDRADKQLLGGLKGKTVLIPGGLSGTGHFAVQLAKNVFGAGRVVTTLSTKKIAKAKELYGEDGIEYIDYTVDDVVAKTGKGTVDYLFDTTAAALNYLPVLKRGGVIISISSVPGGSSMKGMLPDMPYILEKLLNLVYAIFTWWIGRACVSYEYTFMEPSAEDLNRYTQFVNEGKVAPLVGRTAKMSNLKAVREGCQEVYDAKGGVGKFVIDVL